MKLMLLDGNSLTYRAFFALPTDMATASGQVTNAVFGFTSMFINLVKDHKPDGILVAFDRPEPTFRHEANPTYKANREAAPDILRQQMGLVREVLAALRVTVVDLTGWEADDIIATIAEQAEAEGHDVLIVTGDRDSLPARRTTRTSRCSTTVVGSPTTRSYDEAGIAEKTGVTPALYPQYAALRGDPSDNLDGVPGVGEKTAAKLINTYGGLDGIFANVDKQTPKLQRLAGRARGPGAHNHELMVLRRDAPIEVDFDALGDRSPTSPRSHGCSTSSSSAACAPASTRRRPPSARAPTGDRRVVRCSRPRSPISPRPPTSRSRPIAALESSTSAAAWVGEPGRSESTGWPWCSTRQTAEVVWIPPTPSPHDDGVLAAVAAHPSLRSHNAKALMRWMLGRGIAVDGLRLDTPIAAYLIDPADTRYALADLLQRYTPYQLPADDAAGRRPARLRRRRRATTAESPRPPGAGRQPPVGGARGRARQAGDARAVPRPSRTRSSSVLAKMEHVGIAVDITELRRLNDRFTAEVRAPRRRAGARRRPAVQPQLADPAPRDPLHRAPAGPVEEDQDRVLHRRGHAGEAARPVAGVHRSAAAVPRGGEAARHVRHRAARRGRARRADPRHVQPDRRPHRPASQRPAQPAQHPRAPRGGSPVPQGVHPRARQRAARRRLQPDRAALHRPPRRRTRG